MDPWLAWYNETWGDGLTLSQITDWHVTKFIKDEAQPRPEQHLDIYSFFHPEKTHKVQPPLYRDLTPLDGAVEGLRALHEAGHDILLATAVEGETAGEKHKWCQRHIPFIPRRNIFTGSRKERIHGDIFIDDGPHNLTAHHEKWGIETALMTIAYPYNEESQKLVDVYARGYRDTRSAWETIVEAVGRLAE
jgi:5'(3')-deoxyribonucleotidase